MREQTYETMPMDGESGKNVAIRILLAKGEGSTGHVPVHKPHLADLHLT